MRVLVPFDAREPKTRLDPVLDPDERAAFARAMLADVLDAVRTAGHAPEVLATAPVDVDAPVTVDERPLSPAVNGVLSTCDRPVAVVAADLPLATPAALAELAEPDADLVLAPGLGGGTNALSTRHPAFRVDYHDGSYRAHRAWAADRDATLVTLDSFRLAVDIDEPADLAELLIHGDGRGAAWLQEVGFELVAGERGLAARRD